jgi:hypothetical protein
MNTRPARFATVLLVLAAVVSVPVAARAAGPDATAGQQPTPPAPRAGGGAPPVIVNVTESIAIVDTPAALPPAVIKIRESVGVSDRPGGSPPPTEPTPRRTP